MGTNIAKRSTRRAGGGILGPRPATPGLTGGLKAQFRRWFARSANDGSPRGYRREGFPDLEVLQTSIGGRSRPAGRCGR